MRKFILGLLLISFYSCFRNQDFLTDDTNQLTIVSLSKANISREEKL